MGKSCVSCIRVLMIVFNTLFTIIGLLVLAAGLYFFFSTFGIQGMEKHNVLAYLFIAIAVVGAVSVTLGILGCCGSYHYSRCLLTIYFILLLIIFAVETAIGAAGFIYRNEARDIIHETLKEGVSDAKSAPLEEFRYMDGIQIMFHCCGYDSHLDYGLSTRPSCCANMDCSPKDFFINKEGCKHRINDLMHSFFVICVAVISVAVVELIGLIFAMTLCCAVTGRSHETYYEPVRTT